MNMNLLLCFGMPGLFEPSKEYTPFFTFFLSMQVTTCKLPTLPRYKELICELGPIHARLSYENTIATKRPVYKCSEVQVFRLVNSYSSQSSYISQHL